MERQRPVRLTARRAEAKPRRGVQAVRVSPSVRVAAGRSRAAHALLGLTFVVPALLTVACGAPVPAERAIDLAEPGRCVPDHAVAGPAAGTAPSLVQARAGAIDCYLRLPARAEVVFRLVPAAADGVRVSVKADDADEAAVSLARHGDEWRGALAGAAGQPVRLRLESRSGQPLTWIAPRVVGTLEPAAPLLGPPMRPPAEPINVILYVVDALRADRLSVYGYERATSPSLEAVARHGVVFLNAYAAGPNTMGSIPSLLTSRHPWQLGGHLRPSADVPTRPVAEVFRAAGYQTGAFQANFLLIGPLGFERGFDTYEVLREVTPTGPRRVNAEALHARVLEWIRAHRERPFFLYVQSLDVHDPYDPPPPFRGRFSQGQPVAPPENPASVRGGDTRLVPAAEEAIRSLVEKLHPERYDDSVAYADHEIGNLLAALGEIGVRERTAIVVTADHGESLGAGGRYLHGHSLREELIHVPLVLGLPWMREGVRIGDVVSLLDVAPTMLDLAGLAVPPDYLGRSLFQAPSPTEPAAAMGARLTGLGGADAKPVEWYVREGPWKLKTDGERLQLFHLPGDRDEAEDLSARRPAQTGYLAGHLRRARSQASGSGRAQQLATELNEAQQKEVERSLRALGYIE
jgi:arylsulfatase